MSQAGKTILLVEDNQDDVFAMRRALAKARIAYPLQVVTDGQQALDYLSGAEAYADRQQHPLPGIIFLDLKLPYLDGFEVLNWMRAHGLLDAIVVVVLTSSAEGRDQDRVYTLGARSYLIKPPTPEALGEVFQSLKSFWLAKQAADPVAPAF